MQSCAMQKQTTVTAYLTNEQLLWFLGEIGALDHGGKFKNFILRLQGFRWKIAQ